MLKRLSDDVAGVGTRSGSNIWTDTWIATLGNMRQMHVMGLALDLSLSYQKIGIDPIRLELNVGSEIVVK